MFHGNGANGADRALSAAAIQELQAEYDIFRESSNQLEKELEEELKSTQKTAKVFKDEIWWAKEENRELKTRFTKQLLECQRELARVREEKSSVMHMIREKEEALEQAVENERRATAEVESLREALDDNSEMVVFLQTELEGSKTSDDEKTREHYRELETSNSDQVCAHRRGSFLGRSFSSSTRTGAGVAMSRGSDEERLSYGHGENANDANDANDEEARSNGSDPCYAVFRGVEDVMRALSSWRPFAWCQPR